VIRTLGRYELIEQVGTGGMAAVYRGRDTVLDREVAVKLLHPHLAARPESRARFSREARAVARLAHPAILEIYDYSGDDAPESYLVTEFVHGRTLREFQADVGFAFPEIGLLVGRALTDALVHAHGAGVIHRDLKPENVLVQGGDRPGVKLADFGIARILASDERLTMTGALVGSPHHMAPEIVEGHEADARSDLFSLGTVLYWLATGTLPFSAANPTAILRRLLEGAYEDPRAVDPRVPDALVALLTRMLSVDPGARPADAKEVLAEVERILAEVGIDQPERALEAFLRDPAGFKAGFLARALPALRARAAEAVAAGKAARAVAYLGRILALAPGDAEASQALARLTSGARRRRVLGIALATGLLVVAVGALFVGRSPRTEGPTGSPSVAASAVRDDEPVALPKPAPPLDPDAQPSRPPAAPRERTADRTLQRGAMPAAPGKRDPSPLDIHVRPYAQRALLDSREVAADAQVVRFLIEPGAVHELQIEHPCCFPWVKRLTADEADRLGELRVPLEPRPAHIRVEGPAGTRVLVEGKLLGTAGESQRAPFDVPLPRGESPYEGSVRVVLEPLAGAPRAMSIKLRAGAEVVVAAPGEEGTR
jgi:serine/threonine-protein kinase